MTHFEFLEKYIERGACTCGLCVDSGPGPEKNQPEGHTVDVGFFKVKLKNDPTRDEFRKTFSDIPIWDGEEHGYIEIGAEIGDQGAALMMMGAGSLLGLFKILTPDTIFGDLLPIESKRQLIGSGMVSIISKEESDGQSDSDA